MTSVLFPPAAWYDPVVGPTSGLFGDCCVCLGTPYTADVSSISGITPPTGKPYFQLVGLAINRCDQTWTVSNYDQHFYTGVRPQKTDVFVVPDCDPSLFVVGGVAQPQIRLDLVTYTGIGGIWEWSTNTIWSGNDYPGVAHHLYALPAGTHVDVTTLPTWNATRQTLANSETDPPTSGIGTAIGSFGISAGPNWYPGTSQPTPIGPPLYEVHHTETASTYHRSDSGAHEARLCLYNGGGSPAANNVWNGFTSAIVTWEVLVGYWWSSPPTGYSPASSGFAGACADFNLLVSDTTVSGTRTRVYHR